MHDIPLEFYGCLPVVVVGSSPLFLLEAGGRPYKVVILDAEPLALRGGRYLQH